MAGDKSARQPRVDLFKTNSFVWMALCVALFSACGRPKPEEILVRWNQTSITVADLTKELKRRRDIFRPEGAQSSSLAAEVRKTILSEMVDRKLLLQEAQKQGVQVEPEELAQEIRKYKSSYTELSFQKMLKERAFTQEEWVDIKKENLLIQKYLLGLNRAGVGQSDAELEKYYQEHLKEFQISESVHVRQIVTDTKEKAESILRRLQNGENFAKLAQDLSLSPDREKGGDLGFIKRGSFPREFEICFSMKPGEISPIIPSLYGFHLFKILEKAPARTLEFSEAREEIEIRLKDNAKEEFVKKHLEGLRAEAKIEINEKILERVEI